MNMRTAISIPDDQVTSAEVLARRLDMSRSELYSKAVRQFVEQHVKADLVERINRVIDEQGMRLEPDIERQSAQVIKGHQWP